MSLSWSEGVRRLRRARPDLAGSGIRIAVLDMDVEDAPADGAVVDAETLISSNRHAAAIASLLTSDADLCPGLVPEATLLGVPCFSSDGAAEPRCLERALETAAREQVHVVLLGGGLTQGVGPQRWDCPDGMCGLCRTADRLVSEHNIAVVAPAGNNHGRALPGVAARDRGTEILCPAQARSVVAVGAFFSVRPYRPLAVSSRGPSSYGAAKPDVSAPGAGLPCWTKSGSSGCEVVELVSGTSAAAALVAGFLAVLVQLRLRVAPSYSVGDIVSTLFELTSEVELQRNPHASRVFGRGCLDSRTLLKIIETGAGVAGHHARVGGRHVGDIGESEIVPGFTLG